MFFNADKVLSSQSGGGGKNGGDKGASGISRLLGAAKLQSAPGADNPLYATGVIINHLVQVWPYLLGYYKFGATRDKCAAQDEAARCQYENTVSEWLAVEAIVTQCDREAMEANIARLSAEQNAAADAAATSSAEAAVRAAAAMLEVVDEGVQADEPRSSTTEDGCGMQEQTSTPVRRGGLRYGSTTRLTDDGFGGSLSSDGGSKHDTPVSLHGDDAASDVGQRQRFFVVTNPTVDDTSSSTAAAAAAAGTTVPTDFDNYTIALLQQEGSSSCYNVGYFLDHELISQVYGHLGDKTFGGQTFGRQIFSQMDIWATRTRRLGDSLI